jgi:hypothetical protein
MSCLENFERRLNMMRLAFFLVLLAPLSAQARDNTPAMLKALSAQVAEMAQQLKQANARIGELEKKLGQQTQELPKASPAEQQGRAGQAKNPPPLAETGTASPPRENAAKTLSLREKTLPRTLSLRERAG